MSAIERRLQALEHRALGFRLPEPGREDFLLWVFWNSIHELILRVWGRYTYHVTDLELNLLGYMSAVKGLQHYGMKTGVWRLPSGAEIEIVEGSDGVTALQCVRVDDLPEYMASLLEYYDDAPYSDTQEQRIEKLRSLWEVFEHEDPYDILNEDQKNFLKRFDWYPAPVPGEVAS